MTELGQPTEQRNVNRFNKNYSVYTWNFGLTGTMLGNIQSRLTQLFGFVSKITDLLLSQIRFLTILFLALAEKKAYK